MQTLTDDDIKLEPTQLLDEAHRGRATVVTSQGQVLLISLPLHNGAPAAGLLLELAVALYENEQISLGRAAEIAGLPYVEMMDELGRRDVATIRLRPGELDHELAAMSQ